MAETVDGLEPLRNINANKAIQERLSRYIQSRRMTAGDRLPSEGALAQALGVSRGTLREAMRGLQAIGVLEARVGSGWYVGDFDLAPVARGLSLTLEADERTFRELNEIRAGLEWLYLGQAMRTLDAEDYAFLEKAVDGMETLAEVGQSYFDQDRDFHERLFAKVPNQLLERVLALFWGLCAHIAPQLRLEDADEHRAAARRHRELLEAIRAGDLGGARRVLLQFDAEIHPET